MSKRRSRAAKGWALPSDCSRAKFAIPLSRGPWEPHTVQTIFRNGTTWLWCSPCFVMFCVHRCTVAGGNDLADQTWNSLVVRPGFPFDMPDTKVQGAQWFVKSSRSNRQGRQGRQVSCSVCWVRREAKAALHDWAHRSCHFYHDRGRTATTEATPETRAEALRGRYKERHRRAGSAGGNLIRSCEKMLMFSDVCWNWEMFAINFSTPLFLGVKRYLLPQLQVIPPF